MTRARIDWNQVRQRLAASEAALAESESAGGRKIEEAYRRRAIELAKRPAGEEPAAESMPALVSMLGRERVAIAIKEVAEVLPLTNCVAAPGGPKPVLGVINVRGELRAVVDLRRLLAPEAATPSEGGFVLLLRRPGQEIGVKIDRVEGVEEIRSGELAAQDEARYVKGVTADGVRLLDVEAVIAAAYARGGE